MEEIDLLPLEKQARRLRFLQQGRRVVATATPEFRVRHRDGRFREDLYYRLGGHPIDTVPLRERRQDIARLAQAAGLTVQSEAAFALLGAYDWPGNLRELELVRATTPRCWRATARRTSATSRCPSWPARACRRAASCSGSRTRASRSRTWRRKPSARHWPRRTATSRRRRAGCRWSAASCATGCASSAWGSRRAPRRRRPRRRRASTCRQRAARRKMLSSQQGGGPLSAFIMAWIACAACFFSAGTPGSCSADQTNSAADSSSVCVEALIPSASKRRRWFAT